MKSRAVAWGVALLVVGCTLFFSVWGAQGFGDVQLPESGTESKTHVVDKRFSSVQISETFSDVHIEPSYDGSCRVEYVDSSFGVHKITVENDCLKISVETLKGRKWWENISFGNDFEPQLLVLYLPEGEYASLTVTTASGGIYAGGGFRFDTVEAATASGDVDMGNIARHSLSAATASGDIRIGGVEADKVELGTASGDISFGKSSVSAALNLGSASGDIELSDISCGRLEAGSASGSIELRNVIAEKEMEIESTSGNIRLDMCDAASLELESTSGYISGVLLSGKDFDTDTNSGDVDVPRGSKGGRCSIETTSGDIDFEIAE